MISAVRQQGQSCVVAVVPPTAATAVRRPRCLRLFIQRQCEAYGKKPEAFFSKITPAENVEDALDDVVDRVVQVAVLDRVALEAYQRRKPGRFRRLKEVAHSPPFPPTVPPPCGRQQ